MNKADCHSELFRPTTKHHSFIWSHHIQLPYSDRVTPCAIGSPYSPRILKCVPIHYKPYRFKVPEFRCSRTKMQRQWINSVKSCFSVKFGCCANYTNLHDNCLDFDMKLRKQVFPFGRFFTKILRFNHRKSGLSCSDRLLSLMIDLRTDTATPLNKTARQSMQTVILSHCTVIHYHPLIDRNETIMSVWHCQWYYRIIELYACLCFRPDIFLDYNKRAVIQ